MSFIPNSRISVTTRYQLGLEKYEKNFKKRHFTDPTLPLLTDRELQEVNIPGGAGLLILDHIKRYHKMENRK
ncbi:hypothetical protein F2Q70_00031839 [Brassica cretica]|uniref:SAM domain-containing protein n=1 Tax=Brassica cretica TaxID=69181 RepID=A0A8S9FKP4_BRACR|nr:hypothetical protein F2Q70_00031839 [Brassica cretica]